LLHDDRLSAYVDQAAREARNYDRTQDISPRQMLLLLEVAERAGANLGQMLATGEHESARTWNDHIRPPIGKEKVGKATGVWQFQPTTFHRIIQRYGERLLSLTNADVASGTGPLDLSAGPFCDSQVRMIIQDTIDGLRNAEDNELLLLRHNFAVLAFSKHFLSVDTGATNPVEDYLFHFLGENRGRRILKLANGPSRNTLTVKPKPKPKENLPPAPDALGLNQHPRAAVHRGRYLDHGPGAKLQQRPAYLGRAMVQPAYAGRARARARAYFQPAIPSSDAYVAEPPGPPAVSSEHGFDYDSAVVTSNLGMFYRDREGRSNPYTWAEFMTHLSRRVKAEKQPAMVRAKYGVGFHLEGGDMPDRAFRPENVKKPRTFRHRDGEPLPLPEAMILGTLTPEETAEYKKRLQALLEQGEAAPTEILNDKALAALRDLDVLSADVEDRIASSPSVRKALRAFRNQVGKAKPDDPEHEDQLLPAEQVALELYGRRLSHFHELQTEQIASAPDSPDLKALKKMPKGLQHLAAPHVVLVQNALVAEGLLELPKKKRVWRDKKRRKRTSYKTVPFRGLVDKSTLAALERFQLRNGLRQTGGVLDAVTQRMLGLPVVEADELFQPLGGPMCPAESPADKLTLYEILIGRALPEPAPFTPIEHDNNRNMASCALGAPCAPSAKDS
jgi:hypothetical protein